MTMSKNIRSYGLLISLLWFPLRWLKWMTVIGAVLIIMGIPLYYFMDRPELSVVGIMLMAVNIIMSFVVFPSQMLAINSSKQFRLLDGLRKKTGVILFLFCILITFIFFILGIFFDRKVALDIYVAIFLMASLGVVVGVLVSSRWSWKGIGVMYISLWLIGSAFSWLLTINIFYLLTFIAVCWGVFFRWWLSWKPKSYYMNMFGMTQAELFNMQANRSSFFAARVFKLKAKPLSLMGSMVLSDLDSWQKRIQIALMGPMLIGCMYIFFNLIMDADELTRVFTSSKYIYACLMCISFGVDIEHKVFRNLPKVWMHYFDARCALFISVERLCISQFLLIVISALTVYWVMGSFFLGLSLDYYYMVSLLLYCFLVMVIIFYTKTILYCKSKLSELVGMLILPMWLIASLGIFLLVSKEFYEYEMATQVMTLIVILTLLAYALLMRVWAKKAWSRVDFVRIKM